MGSFATRLRQARLDMAARTGREVRQTEVADHMGVSRAAYSQWEGGATEPKNRKDYERLAKFLGVDPGWLAFGTHYSAIPTDGGSEEPAERPMRRLSKGKRA